MPSRRKLRERLLAEIPPAVVVEDDGPPPGNPWRGYQLCLRALLEQEWTHGVIIQDDARVCQNFGTAVERIARIFPSVPVCLFYPGLKMRSARAQQKAAVAGKSFFLLSRQDLMPVVAVLWPKEKAEFLLNWTQGRKLPGLRPPYRSDDAVAGIWMRNARQDVYVVFPSLVQHPDDADPVKDGGHVAKHGADRGRVALSYIEGDPLEKDWQV